MSLQAGVFEHLFESSLQTWDTETPSGLTTTPFLTLISIIFLCILYNHSLDSRHVALMLSVGTHPRALHPPCT